MRKESLWGGKANNLLRAEGFGFSVPKFFPCSQEWVHSWLCSMPLYSSALEQWRWNQWETLEKFRAGILVAPRPDFWETYFSSLPKNREKWIVRSSMNIEDQEGSSFAGAFQSLCGEGNSSELVFSAFRQVVASGFTREAAERILAAGIDPATYRPTAFFQVYVQGKVSGVAFSRDPQNFFQPLIETHEGGAEAIVQGTALPLKSELPRFATLLGDLEKMFDQPVDVEFTWDGSKVWILQVRPIAGDDGKWMRAVYRGQRFNRELAEERFPERMSLLGWTAIADLLPSNLLALKEDFGLLTDSSREMALYLNGRVFSDPDYFRFPDRVRLQWRRLSPLSSVFWSLIGALLRFPLDRVRLGAPMASNILSTRLLLSFVEKQAQGLRTNWKSHVERCTQKLQVFERSIQDLPRKEILSKMEELRKLSMEFLRPDLTTFFIKDSLRAQFSKLWQSKGLAKEEFPLLVNDFGGNRTIEMGQAWEGLVKALKNDPQHEEFLSRLERGDPDPMQILLRDTKTAWLEFMHTYGHSRTTWDLARPSWREEPGRLVPLLRSSIRVEQRIVKTQKHTIEFFEKFPPVLAVWLREKIVLLQDFMRMDEELHFCSGSLLEPSRKLILQAGELFVEKGILENQSQVFFLTLAEVKQSLAHTSFSRTLQVRKRISEWNRKQNEKNELPFPLAALQRSNQNWIGIPVSAGEAEGTVHFLEHLEDAKDLPSGAILVTTAPNPAFVPLFPVLGGLITATGGQLSHGFVAAREYGLPAVSGAGFALDQLQQGERVRLDGSSGKITRINA